MNLSPFLSYALAVAGAFKYPIIFIGTIVEGPLLMIASGFLLRLGVLSLIPLYFTLWAADLLADIGWYYVGYFFADRFVARFGRYFGVTPELFAKAKGLFARYHDKILLISKATIGFGMALGTLIAAGATRVPIRRFIALNAIGELGLVAFLLAVGYFFGQLYGSIAGGFKFVFAAAAALVAVAFVFGFSRYMKGRIASE